IRIGGIAMSISVRPVSAGDRARTNGVLVRPLREEDLPVADHIMRLAFGTFLGLPNPLTFMGDADCVRTRWAANPTAALGAEVGGELVGSNFATKWGSVAFFGPLTVRPDYWDRGVAQRLLAATMELFERWEIRHAGLFTFAESPRIRRLPLWTRQRGGEWRLLHQVRRGAPGAGGGGNLWPTPGRLRGAGF